LLASRSKIASTRSPCSTRARPRPAQPELVARLAKLLDVIKSSRDFVDGPTQIGLDQ
jgi:hypothetical protein